jgi:hypothetical protein
VLLLGSNHFHKWSLRLPQWRVSAEGKKRLSLFHSNASHAFLIKFSVLLEGYLYTKNNRASEWNHVNVGELFFRGEEFWFILI